MKSGKVATATAALAVAATVLAPSAHAGMQIGNYDLLTNRYTRASWAWMISLCVPEKTPDCVTVSGISRLKYYYEYGGRAYLVNGRYTMTVDVPDGLQCPGQVLPTHETWTWDDSSLAGTIESNYDVGCFNGPPGSQFWTFALRRL